MRKSPPFGMLILTISFLSGGLLGFFMSGLISDTGEITVGDYFISYFTAVQEGSTSPNLALSFWTNIKSPLLAFLLGFSFLGSGILPLLFIVEGFYFTFSISTLCRYLGIVGLVPAFFLFCVPALVWIPMLFTLGFQSFYASIQLWRRGKKEEAYPTGYFLRSACCFCGIFLTIAFEYLLLPLIMQGILT